MIHTLESIIVAEIPDILEISENLDAIMEDRKEKSVGINKSSKILTQSLDDFDNILDEHAGIGDVEIVKKQISLHYRKLTNVSRDKKIPKKSKCFKLEKSED